MLVNIWSSSEYAATKLGISELKLSNLRESGLLKPGIHWISSPTGQKKPWNPKALYDIRLCKKIVNKIYLEENDVTAA